MATSEIYTDALGNLTAIKDPQAVLDYSFDWSAWLEAISDTIVSAVFTAVGCTAVSQGVAEGVATAMVSGGEVGQVAAVTCRITTAAGRVDDRTINFLIKHR